MLAAGLPVRHIECGLNVPSTAPGCMFVTALHDEEVSNG
jgi:hypothetical protein